MPSKTYEIKTEHNTWTFDVSLPVGGVPKVLRVYGDVTSTDHLNEALQQLAGQVEWEQRLRKVRPPSRSALRLVGGRSAA